MTCRRFARADDAIPKPFLDGLHAIDTRRLSLGRAGATSWRKNTSVLCRAECLISNLAPCPASAESEPTRPPVDSNLC
eukprot:7230761-Pyramimonas_sp.AAC.1